MTYKYPKSLWVIAEEIADWRTTLNKSNRSNNPRFDRGEKNNYVDVLGCLLYTSPSPRDRTRSRMPSSA